MIERLEQFIKNQGLSVSSFERTISASDGVIRHAIRKNSDIQGKWIKAISENYPELSLDWLLKGEGEMLKDESPIAVQQIHYPKSIEKEYTSQTINLYDFEASAGLRELFDNNRENIIDTIRIPNLPKCDGAIHITGDSMYPLLKSGDIVLYKEMTPRIDNLFWGEMYLLSYAIDDEYYVVVKYVKKSPKGEPYVTLASQNPNHAEKDIDFRHVNAMALVKASIRINSMI